MRGKILIFSVVDADKRAVGLLSFGDVNHLVGQELASLLGPVAPGKPKLAEQAD